MSLVGTSVTNSHSISASNTVSGYKSKAKSSWKMESHFQDTSGPIISTSKKRGALHPNQQYPNKRPRLQTATMVVPSQPLSPAKSVPWQNFTNSHSKNLAGANQQTEFENSPIAKKVHVRQHLSQRRQNQQNKQDTLPPQARSPKQARGPSPNVTPKKTLPPPTLQRTPLATKQAPFYNPVKRQIQEVDTPKTEVTNNPGEALPEAIRGLSRHVPIKQEKEVLREPPRTSPPCVGGYTPPRNPLQTKQLSTREQGKSDADAGPPSCPFPPPSSPTLRLAPLRPCKDQQQLTGERNRATEDLRHQRLITSPRTEEKRLAAQPAQNFYPPTVVKKEETSTSRTQSDHAPHVPHVPHVPHLSRASQQLQRQRPIQSPACPTKMEEEGQGNETGSRKAEGGTTAPCLSKDEMEVRKLKAVIRKMRKEHERDIERMQRELENLNEVGKYTLTLTSTMTTTRQLDVCPSSSSSSSPSLLPALPPPYPGTSSEGGYEMGRGGEEGGCRGDGGEEEGGHGRETVAKFISKLKKENEMLREESQLLSIQIKSKEETIEFLEEENYRLSRSLLFLQQQQAPLPAPPSEMGTEGEKSIKMEVEGARRMEGSRREEARTHFVEVKKEAEEMEGRRGRRRIGTEVGPPSTEVKEEGGLEEEDQQQQRREREARRKRQVHRLVEKYKLLKTKLVRCQKEREAEIQKLQKKETELASLRKHYLELEGECRRESEKAKERENFLEAKLDTLKRKREELGRENREHRETIMSLTEQLDKSQADLITCRQQNSDLAEELSVEELKARLVNIFIALKKKALEQDVDFDTLIARNCISLKTSS